MNKAVSVCLLLSFLLISCSEPVNEVEEKIRLPAETAEVSEEPVYNYLEKVELRSRDTICRCFFFKDGSAEGEQAVYMGNGITARVRLIRTEQEDPVSLMEEVKMEALEQLSGYETLTCNEQRGNGYSLIEISYVKEDIRDEGKKVTTIRYPCMYIIKSERLADENYRIVTLEVDNEHSTEQTGVLLEEFLDAYGITVQ